MIIVYGKGAVGTGLHKLLTLLDLPHILMDDHDRDDLALSQASTIISSPGIPPHHNIQIKYGPKIVSELHFLGKTLSKKAWRPNFQTVGITGTNGKSTTTRAAYQAFKIFFAAKNIPRQVHITGNFSPSLSTTLADILTKGEENQQHLLIIECSSFMLHNLKYFSFDYGILLNISPTHLDRHTDVEEYRTSKQNIISYARQHVVCKTTDPKIKTRTQKHFVGQHNYSNLSVVSALMRTYASDHEVALRDDLHQKIFSQIVALPHRCQYLGQIQGINVYDDGICTDSFALQKALEGMSGKVLLICGGVDQCGGFDHLDGLFVNKISAAVCMGTSAAPVFCQQFNRLEIENRQTLTMSETITQAFAIAKKNQISTILFSPGCSSFDIFTNVYERIAQFEEEMGKRA